MTDERITVTQDICGWEIAITAPHGATNWFGVMNLELDIFQQTEGGEFGQASLRFGRKLTDEMEGR